MNNNIVDYKSFLSKKGLKRDPLPEKLEMTYQLKDGWVIFGAGIPNPCFYPFSSMDLILNDDCNSKISLDPKELAISQNYSQGFGYPGLLEVLVYFQIRTHNLKNFENNYGICLTNGAQHGISVVLENLLDEGDSIILEEPTYGGLFGVTFARNINLVGLGMDDEGILIDELKSTLSNWNIKEKPFPKLLYLIPTGQNPTGIIYSNKRKRDILEVARSYNLLIVEDDPHYFLQFGNDEDSALDKLPLEPSFLSMDTDGRVIRLDTFSKILAGGIRFGFITSHPFLNARFREEVNGTMFHINGISQLMMMKLLEKWGDDGWNKHIRMAQRFLKYKRDSMKEILDKHLGDLVQYRVPDAGMYFWLKFPDIDDTFDFIFKYMVDLKVLFGAGSGYSCYQSQKQYVRACFSHIPVDLIDKSIEKFSQTLKMVLEQINFY
ncbi:kynurenine/alpha-aminoadipate aminotransferase-like protein [Heterostelium album PN500]|uniref:Kynurenine/alpha-aminoadipate aminotransferase-like protein n=1 Tax=Heterostelium pallidum (strain ATCC 26659 / Pp 5 / PN500) TaxID=670386 RepID=D3AWU6_HETP5|nr:kynurenine/alpha-aminoadipate aminotransferase-like protein [Heterostelium album PN500]EFA86769.1 kynurenine/alpha-aminoadipate aminotransferase-like protein [Heterostelium album PN500]|eukprot:XP_020438873.1 kynurenine/alpha-aminoadipate aminotransferase-like protein [Heterostelium album PN500]